jgi:Tfp pilus assembly protein PilF
VIAWKRIQRQFPDFADAWTNASTLLNEMERAEEALDMALRAVELDPENPLAIYALANAHLNLKHLDEGALHLRNVIERDPKHAMALANLAGICANRWNLAEALELYDRAIQVQPLHSIFWERRANTKLLLSDMTGTEADLLQALKLDPNSDKARRSLTYILFLQNRYSEAWAHYREGYLSSATALLPSDPEFGKPHWRGEPLNGRTLFVYTKRHGFGDVIQFARLFPQIQRNMSGRVLFSIFEPIKRLFTGLSGVDELHVVGEPLPDFDLSIPLIELPLVLNVEPSCLPPPIEIPTWNRSFISISEFDKPRLKVGLVWAGSPTFSNDVQRSMNPRFLDDLADMPGIAWYGLQKPSAVEPPKLPGFIDMSPHMGDFMDTAQIAMQLDLIVTVDTSMAHLAGSLGLPTIVLLSYMPDWRWGLGEHTPWYPTLKLLRQPAHNDWKGTVSLLKQRISTAVPLFRKKDALT